MYLAIGWFPYYLCLCSTIAIISICCIVVLVRLGHLIYVYGIPLCTRPAAAAMSSVTTGSASLTTTAMPTAAGRAARTRSYLEMMQQRVPWLVPLFDVDANFYPLLADPRAVYPSHLLKNAVPVLTYSAWAASAMQVSRQVTSHTCP